MYRQCKLEKNNSIRVCWIPEKFAAVGKTLKIKNRENVWENGWLVKEVWQKIREPVNFRKIIREHKKNTGDNL